MRKMIKGKGRIHVHYVRIKEEALQSEDFCIKTMVDDMLNNNLKRNLFYMSKLHNEVYNERGEFVCTTRCKTYLLLFEEIEEGDI